MGWLLEHLRVGQTGRRLKTKMAEHQSADIRGQNTDSQVAEHVHYQTHAHTFKFSEVQIIDPRTKNQNACW